MDETEIELRDVTQYLMPPPHSFTERVCLAIRWAGIILSTMALGVVRQALPFIGAVARNALHAGAGARMRAQSTLTHPARPKRRR